MKLILMKKVKSYLMVAVGLVVNMVRVSSKIVLRPSNGVKYFKISGSNIKGLVWCQKKYNKKKSTVSFRSSEEIRCLWIDLMEAEWAGFLSSTFSTVYTILKASQSTSIAVYTWES